MRRVLEQIETRPGFKRTRIGLVPEEWELKELQEFGEIVSGLTYSPDDVREQGTLILRSSNIQNGQLALDDCVYVDTTDLVFNPVRNGDVLICVRNGSRRLIGKSLSITKELEGQALGAFMSVFRSEEPLFFGQLLKTHQYYSEVHRNLGATINSINSGNLKKFKFAIPPAEERQKIAQILSTWDRAIRTTEQLISACQERKRGLMQQLLSGKTRFPGFDEEWEEVKLGDIVSFSKGKGIAKSEIQEEGLPAIRYGELYTNHHVIVKSFRSRISAESAAKSKEILKGDILCAGSGETAEEIGKCATYLGEETVYVGGDIVIASPKKGVDSYFLSSLLNSPIGRRELNRLGQGNSVVHIYKSGLETVSINLPSLQEQQLISTAIREADSLIDALDAQLEELRTQKKGMMQKLLTGNVRVKIDKS